MLLVRQGQRDTLKPVKLARDSLGTAFQITRGVAANVIEVAMKRVKLGHDVIIGDNCILANCATLAGHVEMGNNAVIGGMTPIHQFVKIILDITL